MMADWTLMENAKSLGKWLGAYKKAHIERGIPDLLSKSEA
jgi:hypothetical protein